MAAIRLKKSGDWKRQQSCPIIRSNVIEARADMINVVHIANQKSLAMAKPTLRPKRVPMPSPRTLPEEDECPYVDHSEVNSPSQGRRSTSSPNIQTNRHSYPSASSPNRSPATDRGSPHYYKVLVEDGPASNGDEFTYDYTRFQSNPPQQNGSSSSGSHYKVLEPEDGDFDVDDEDDEAYSEPRHMLSSVEPPQFAAPKLPSVEPPQFAAPKLPKSRSCPDAQTMPPLPLKSPPRHKPQQHIQGSPSPQPSRRAPNSTLPHPPVKAQKPAIRPGKPLQVSSSLPGPRLSPGSDRYLLGTPQGSVDIEEENDDDDYHYPAMDRIALPYFKPRAGSPTSQERETSPRHLNGHQQYAPPPLPGSIHSHPLPGEQTNTEESYIYNEPLDSSVASRLGVDSEHIYESGLPPSLPRKPSVTGKPLSPKPQPAGKPVRPRKPSTPAPSRPGSGLPSTGDGDDDSNDDLYYEPPPQLGEKQQRKPNYLKLNDEPTPWYHGQLCRGDAEKLLVGHPCGTYLLRDGQKHRGYTLSMSRGSNQCRHFQVNHCDDGAYKLGSFDNSHKTLHKLVLFCHQHAINSSGEMLTKPLPMH